MLAKRKSKYLAVPSTGPIPLRRPWCSGNDRFRVSCSTLYRAYPIATISNHSILLHQYILQYPLPGLSHCDPSRAYLAHQRVAPCSTLYRAYPIATTVRECRCDRPKNPCSTLYRAYPIATPAIVVRDWKQENLAVPSTGPIPLRPRMPSLIQRRIVNLAVPSTGPIPLRLIPAGQGIEMLRNLQYPLPGLSHCDCFLKRNGAMPTEPCSTLYRAYPIATSAGCAPRCSSASLQYPLPGLSHCDTLSVASVLASVPLAVPSTGPIPLRL